MKQGALAKATPSVLKPSQLVVILSGAAKRESSTSIAAATVSILPSTRSSDCVVGHQARRSVPSGGIVKVSINSVARTLITCSNRLSGLARSHRHPRDPGAERIEPLLDPLIAAFDLVGIVDGRGAFRG